MTTTGGAIGAGRTEFKCAPPIRNSQNNGNLWDALGKGVIDFVVSDHSPSPPAMKCLRSGDFFKAWGGIASLQLGLPAVWTKLSAIKYTLKNLVRWMSSGPAQLAGLEKQKWEPARPVSRAKLIRRAYFDLWGLPPSPEDVRTFVADERPDAYERLVTTETFSGVPDAQAVNTTTFVEKDGRTYLEMLVEHQTKANRDGHLQSGMEGGMQDALALLEELVREQV